MKTPDLQTAFARLFLNALCRAGVRHLVMSPGARSMPLALALEAEPALQAHVVIDERDAAFFALGIARATGTPAAVLSTSGTAPAHWLPAILEASASRLPLVLLSADRPWEQQAAGAAQTIAQLPLFEPHVRATYEVGEAHPSARALASTARIAARAVASTHWPDPGPVHVNLRYRRPLEPRQQSPEDSGGGWQQTWERLLESGPAHVHRSNQTPSEDMVALLAKRISDARRPIVLVGPQLGPLDVSARLGVALDRLWKLTGMPILAESTSDTRYGAETPRIGAFDTFLRVPHVLPPPDLVIELGLTALSTVTNTWIGRATGRTRVCVSPWGWFDPNGTAAAMLQADPAELLERVLVRFGQRTVPGDPSWIGAFDHADKSARENADRLCQRGWHDGVVARELVDSLPVGAHLVIGNSMPVRDLDTWCPPSSKCFHVMHQRGIAGIDGLVAGAAGSAIASGAPTALLLGDIAAQHDLGGFASARLARTPLVIVVVHNGGGRIFQELPVARQASLAGAIERSLVTPQGITFGPVAALFDLPYHRVTSRSALRRALAEAFQSDGATLVEATVPSEAGRQARAELALGVAGALASPGES